MTERVSVGMEAPLLREGAGKQPERVNVANEVVTQPSNANAAPFIKAALRDVKAYLSMLWAMSEYYETTHFDAQSCHFAGNAARKSPPAPIDAAFGSCLAQYPVGVMVPRPDGTSGGGAASATSMTSAPSATPSAEPIAGSNAAAGSGKGSVMAVTIAAMIAVGGGGCSLL